MYVCTSCMYYIYHVCILYVVVLYIFYRIYILQYIFILQYISDVYIQKVNL